MVDGVVLMQPLVRVVPKALTIDLDLITVRDLYRILKHNQGYIDGDSRKLVVWCKK